LARNPARNSKNTPSAAEFSGATYVEGAIATLNVGWPSEHGWIVFNGEIIDPTLPEMELQYFPAHQWTGKALMTYSSSIQTSHSTGTANSK